jgi:ribosomal protein S27AE
LPITDFKAAQKWAKLPKDIQDLLVNNVFCSNCGVTTIFKYTLQDDKFGILLKGNCKKCGTDVARLIENE